MPQGARGGADGSQVAQLEAKLAAMERRIDNLRGGRMVGGAEAFGGGGAGARRGARQHGGSKEVQSRPGDWRCSQCSAFPCFARARRCFACGEPRGAGANLSRPHGRTEHLGPVGADGSRPLLGGRSRPQAASGNSKDCVNGTRCPSVRVPGASIAAKAEAERRRGQAGERPAAFDSVDSFQPVRRGTVPKTSMATAASGGGELATAPKVTVVRNSWAALSEEEDEEDCMETDGPGHATLRADGDDDGTGDHDGVDDGADAEDADGDNAQGDVNEGELRKIWQGHVRACKLMEKNAQDFPAKLLDGARALRDAAERQWRAAKQPQPLHKRLRWAEAALREAESKERAHRVELREHLAAADLRTREIEGRIAVDAARTARKRAALDALRHEASPHPLPTSERAARIAVNGIATDVGPHLAAIIERLASPLGDDAEAIRQQLQLVAVSVSKVEGVLREGTETEAHGGGTAHFNIGDPTAGGTTGGGEDGRPCDGDEGDGRNDNFGRSDTQYPTRWAKQAGHSVWRKHGVASSCDAAEDARKLLRERGVGADNVGSATVAGDSSGLAMAAATTNDLAEADRRNRIEAQRQVMEVQRRQQEPRDEEQQRQDELLRQQRLQTQQDEMRKHQAAMQQAARARAEEEAAQRQALIASMSPQELARAAELHAQQAAIGTQIFGTQSASQLAGMVQQAERQRAEQADVEHLMGTSQEEYLAQQNGDSGACPW